ncbi:G patch domain-containing protein 1 homolog [Armigeres subalbatus]|uniref:G patch domain-containing protein 1 homolog n=1 Tax=Armigeres subalbatus TaxID=124917 RepID=UPI002ED54F42
MDEDDYTYCKFGTPLPAYEQDEIPAKKPVSVEDQIVLDVNGKRRFHGAFTGGFSAGYWNTVGSEEGWKPTEFKSSRKEKASARTQNPMDFMDDEDLGEFGIAPQRVQAKEDFAHSSTSSGKRRLDRGNWSGPIPGVPVLRTLLEPAKEKTAVRILKNMGWREGQGIGERQRKCEKQIAKSRNSKELYVMKMYGCAMPGSGGQDNTENDDDHESDDSSDYEITFAPDDFDPLLTAFKDNSFGLGYSGLERSTVGDQKRFNLFDTLEIVDRNNKKLSIRGQAFGVGALEDDDDEDVYSKDDMSRYDFTLEDRSKKPAAIKLSAHQDDHLEGFRLSSKPSKGTKKVFRINVSDSFTPRNWLQRRSRFDPLDETKEQQFRKASQYKVQGLGRHDLNPEKRGQALGEKPLDKSLRTGGSALLDKISKQSDCFSRETGHNREDSKAPQPISENSIATAERKDAIQFDLKSQFGNMGSTKEGFKPFIADPEKQKRYEEFVIFKPSEKLKTKEELLNTLQPLGMSLWDREREFKEFEQAQRMYRPLDGLMSDRFVTESSLIAEKEKIDSSEQKEIKMKRSRTMWKPHKDLCKRFNVEEPYGGMMEEEKTKSKSKFSVFDYLEAPVNRKSDFVTPVIIPQKGEKDVKRSDPVPIRTSAKDFFAEVQTPSTSFESSRSSETLKSSAHLTSLVKSVKRTELEQKVLESLNKKPEEKKDLFQSIFCSSDEEEESLDTNQPSTSSTNEAEKLKLVESLVAIKPASQMNVLRNHSPPRGIFKSIFDLKRPDGQPSAAITIAVSEDSSSSSENDITTQDEFFYGPKLPSSNQAIATTSSSSASTSQANQLDVKLREIERKAAGSKNIIEEWVEKEKISSKKSKRKKDKEHKKSKKHKREKKKHKHKDKR